MHSFFVGWSPRAKYVLGFACLTILIAGLSFGAFILVYHDYNVDIGFTHFRVTHIETDLAKNCRERSKASVAAEQTWASDIQALRAKVAAEDRNLAETRQKCLENASSIPARVPRDWNACSLPSPMEAYTAGPNQGYREVLGEIADHMAADDAKIAALEDTLRQEHQRLDQQCSEGAARSD
jgi:hypothetical protein